MDNVKVSVIVPVYNVEKYLDNCLNSIINQTYHNIEIILVDDESPDRCPALCDFYQANDCRIQVIHQKNKGLPGARNSGLKIATGDWILFVDSDDFLAEDAIEKLIKTIRQDTDIVLFRKQYCKKYNQIKKSAGSGNIISFSDKEVLELLDDAFDPMYRTFKKLKLDVVSAWSKLYRKSFLRDNALFFFEEVKIHEDIPYSIIIYDANPQVIFVDYYIYMYRYNAESITNSFRKKYVDENKILINRLKKLDCHSIDKFIKERMLCDRIMVCTINLLLKCFCHPDNKKEYFERKKDFYAWLELDEIKKAIKNIDVSKYEWKKKNLAILVKKKKFLILDVIIKITYFLKRLFF